MSPVKLPSLSCWQSADTSAWLGCLGVVKEYLEVGQFTYDFLVVTLGVRNNPSCRIRGIDEHFCYSVLPDSNGFVEVSDDKSSHIPLPVPRSATRRYEVTAFPELGCPNVNNSAETVLASFQASFPYVTPWNLNHATRLLSLSVRTTTTRILTKSIPVCVCNVCKLLCDGVPLRIWT